MLSPKYSEEKSSLLNVGSGIYYNLAVENHIEFKKELQDYNEGVYNFKKSNFSFKYNFHLQKYEDYVFKNNSILEEPELISLYDILAANKTSQGFKKINVSNYFNEDLDEGTSLVTGKTVYFFDSQEDKYNGVDKLVVGLEECKPFKNHLPFYTQITFDNIRGNADSLGKLFDKYGIRKKILMFYNSSVSKPARLTNTNLLSLTTDAAFYANYEILKLKNSLSEISIRNEVQTPFDIVGYKVSKYYGKKGFINPVQEWFIPSSSKEVLELVDTQIKYNKKYYYTISAIIATFGAFYTLSSNNQITDVENDVFLFEVKTSDYEGKLLSNPPLPPEVSFLPSIEDPKKIKIYMNKSYGEILQKPVIVVHREDTEFLNDIFNTDIYEGDKVRYKSGADIERYQIFRLEHEPKNMTDFSNGKIIITDPGIHSFEDYIETNKKYYYIIRSIDIHDNSSNPSEIFTVEIINDGGILYPIFAIYDMTKREKLTQAYKVFKKFFSFTPQLNQVFPNDQAEELSGMSEDEALQNVKVGSGTSSLWDKKFKIRLTSNSTGKKIDFNVQFKKEIIKRK